MNIAMNIQICYYYSHLKKHTKILKQNKTGNSLLNLLPTPATFRFHCKTYTELFLHAALHSFFFLLSLLSTEIVMSRSAITSRLLNAEWHRPILSSHLTWHISNIWHLDFPFSLKYFFWLQGKVLCLVDHSFSASLLFHLLDFYFLEGSRNKAWDVFTTYIYSPGYLTHFYSLKKPWYSDNFQIYILWASGLCIQLPTPHFH